MQVGEAAPFFPMATHHEGKALAALLESKKISKARYAAAAGVGQSAVTRHVDAETLGDLAWSRVKKGLLVLGLDPGQIREEPIVMARERTPVRDFTPLLEEWSKDHLRTLREILLSSLDNQDRVAWWIKGKLG